MVRPGSFIGFALVAMVALSSAACTRVHVEDVRGPDGGDWVRVSCRRMDRKCFQAAAAMCPGGYYFTKDAVPAPVSSTGSEGASVEMTSPHPRAGVNAKTLPPQERWGSSMYSRKSGSVLVQCAPVTAKN